MIGTDTTHTGYPRNQLEMLEADPPQIGYPRNMVNMEDAIHKQSAKKPDESGRKIQYTNRVPKSHTGDVNKYHTQICCPGNQHERVLNRTCTNWVYPRNQRKILGGDTTQVGCPRNPMNML